MAKSITNQEGVNVKSHVSSVVKVKRKKKPDAMTNNEYFDAAHLVKTSRNEMDSKLALRIHSWFNN